MSARILVVDDLLPNVRLLQAKLESEYYDVTTAQNGLEALDSIKKLPPDIVLLDVMMPEMDGFETCKRIKQDPKTADIPVVMVTALSDINDRVQGLNAGADDFITKPINDLALFARIRSLVRLKSMTDELKLRDQTGEELGNTELNLSNIRNVANANILLVDDDEAQSQQVSDKLLSIGMKVDIISVPKDAVKASENKDYDLVIVNAEIAGNDGIHLCTHLRTQEATKSTPLLLIIDDENIEVLIKALDMGINDYLVAPVDGNEAVARASIQVRRKRYQDALKATQKENLSLAILDKLTKAYNRHYLDSHLQRMIAAAFSNNKPLAVIMIDLDHFKNVNDTYGHLSGDEVLKGLSGVIMKNIRVTDLLARYGGEEFILVLPNTDVTTAANVAERIRKSIEANNFSIPVDPKQINCTASIGVSCLKQSDTAAELIARADKALYHVKNTGRNKVAVYNG